MPNSEYAKVIKDSICVETGKRIVSIEVKYWRSLHSELMTHRAFARNAASSRAIPFYKERVTEEFGAEIIENCTYSKILNGAFIPEFIGTEQKGMQSGGELAEPLRSHALAIINQMKLDTLQKCKRLYELGVHKSIINRYLEPWSYITVLITATEWKNFFRLRVHSAAEKHFQKFAKLMKTAIGNSVPQELQIGQWHLPYISPEDAATESVREWGKDGLGKLIKISAARCARLSYLTQDGKRDVEEDLKLFERLINPKTEAGDPDDAIHASPLEHAAQALGNPQGRSGPFVGWKQFRKDFPNENVEGM